MKTEKQQNAAALAERVKKIEGMAEIIKNAHAAKRPIWLCSSSSVVEIWGGSNNGNKELFRTNDVGLASILQEELVAGFLLPLTDVALLRLKVEAAEAAKVAEEETLDNMVELRQQSAWGNK